MRKKITKALPKAEAASDSKPKKPISTKLTDKVIEQFTDLVRDGVPASTVCDYLGITGTAFHSWIRKGEDFRNNLGDPPEYELYGKFVKAYRKAHSEFLISCQKGLKEPERGDKNWYRNVIMLERRDRRNWGRNEPGGGTDEQVDSDERFI